MVDRIPIKQVINDFTNEEGSNLQVASIRNVIPDGAGCLDSTQRIVVNMALSEVLEAKSPHSVIEILQIAANIKALSNKCCENCSNEDCEEKDT